MTAPKTLLQMAGASLQPGSLADAVLVVIDAQNEYLDGTLALPAIAPALDEIASLLARARAAGTPVIHVQHAGKAGGLFDLTGRPGQIIDQVAPQDGEAVVQKGLPNSFAGTTFGETLEKTGRKHLVIAGFMTHMCVSATARAAIDQGFSSTVVASACATRPLPDPVTGATVAAEDIHRIALTELSDRFAVIAARAGDIRD